MINRVKQLESVMTLDSNPVSIMMWLHNTVETNLAPGSSLHHGHKHQHWQGFTWTVVDSCLEDMYSGDSDWSRSTPFLFSWRYGYLLCNWKPPHSVSWPSFRRTCIEDVSPRNTDTRIRNTYHKLCHKFEGNCNGIPSGCNQSKPNQKMSEK
jgi:hypothetical protein